MKKTMVIPALMSFLLGGVVFSATLQKPNEKRLTACVLEALDTSGLGEVKFSVLSEAKFQEVNGPEWILLAGQSRSIVDGQVEPGNTSLFNYFDADNFSSTVLPSAGGKFLRVRNNAGSASNPVNAKLGENQDDELKSHNHNTSAGGGSVSNGNIGSYIWWIIAASQYASRSVDATGGAETRPKNITVNSFIKIKRGCLDSVIVDSHVSSDARITALENFASINTCDTCLTMPETDLALLRAKHVCFKNQIENYENDQRQWSVSCTARTVGYSKKVLMLIGAPNRTQDENDYLSHLDNQYPYYNVISTN